MSSDPTTNTLNKGDATVTVRVVKSFPYRNVKPFLAKHLDLDVVTVGQLKELVRKEIATIPAWKPFRTVSYDTLKIYTAAHGHKTTNLVINMEDAPELWLAEDERTLASYGMENEAEVSFFKRQDYDAYVSNPETKW